jgi:Mg/Co/Ni transporter MgtE
MFAFIYVEEGEELQETIAKKLNHPVKKLLKPRRIFVVGPDDDLEKAFQILSKHHFKKIPVVDSNQKVVGVISRGDLVRVITNKLIVDE